MALSSWTILICFGSTAPFKVYILNVWVSKMLSSNTESSILTNLHALLRPEVGYGLKREVALL